MRWRTLMVALVAPSAMAEMSFINPASSSSGGGTLATNPVFMLQTLVTVKWTGTTSNSSSTVVLWQVNASLATPSGDADQLNAAVMGDLEYVARAIDWKVDDTPWTVTTRKDLSVSNMFIMSLYQTGATTPDDWTSYFNITSAAASSSSSSIASSSTSSSSTSSSPTSTSAVPTSTSAVPTNAVATPSSTGESNDNGGMSTGAQAGLGVGVAAAVLIGFVAAWFIVRNRKRAKGGLGPSATPASGEYKYATGRETTWHENGGLQSMSHDMTGRDSHPVAPVEMH